MASQPPTSRTIDDVILLAGRVALGAIFLESGLHQLTGAGAFAANLASRGVPLPMMFAIVGIAVELVCGILIISGIKTRLAALPVILFMIVATVLSHRYWEFPEAARRGQEIHFFKNLSIIGGLLLLMAAGPGRLSIETWFRRKPD